MRNLDTLNLARKDSILVTLEHQDNHMTRDGVRVEYDNGNDVRQMGANGVKLSKFSTLRLISK